MSKEEDDEDGGIKLSLEDSKKMKPPNKKKFDEDMDGLTARIKDKEAELERVRQASVEIRRLKTEKMEYVNKRKQIVIDLDKVNKEIPDRMKRLNEIEASLYYKNEDKINSAIQRLEWNLRVKTYKLTEEKKIVSEIDSLKRSKKNLVQYLALRQEVSEIRDRQKSMRDGRDRCTKEFNRLKSQEEQSRSQHRSLIAIKREIDDLYDQRRQMNAHFKQQRGEFHELKEKHRKESWKKKAEERKVYEEEKRREMAEIESERLPHESDLHTCLTLTIYLNRLLPAMTDTSLDSLSPSSSQDDPEPAEEMEDGQYKLLRRSDDTDSLDHSQGAGGGMRRLSKRNRRVRKHSMDKKLAHPSNVLSQFMSLNLMAPTCLYEVPEVLDQLEKKQSFFEKEQQLCEATSDAGISATESAMCAMSRQASKTESYDEGGVQESASSSSRPDDSVYAALFQQQQESGSGDVVEEELRGAVGGRPAEEDDWSSVVVGVGSETPNSDSTIEGDNGSGDSQKAVIRHSSGDSAGGVKEKNLKETTSREKRREMTRSLAITISDSTDSSSLVEEQPVVGVVGGALEDEFPSLLESSQSSLMSDVSFPSLGTSGASTIGHWSDQGAKQLASPSSAKGHSPLTKTYSVVPQDSSKQQQQQYVQQPQQQMPPQSKSYASSVVSRARSFSEVMPKKSGNTGRGGSSNVISNTVNKRADFGSGFDHRQQQQQQNPILSKQIQPPSTLSISPSSSLNVNNLLTPTASSSSSKSKPSIHRSRTLTPTLTRSWVEVRDKHRKSSGSSGGNSGNPSPSSSFSSSTNVGGGLSSGHSKMVNNANNPTVTSPVKIQVSPSLSSSAIPSPHRSVLSPRFSYPLQSKPSLATPTQPMIVIDDDKDFPPLSQTITTGHNNTSRRNSNLSTKSSGGSTSLHDRDHPQNTNTITTTSDNNNNNSISIGISNPATSQATNAPLTTTSILHNIAVISPTSKITTDHNTKSLSGNVTGTTNISVSALDHNVNIDPSAVDPDLSSLPKGDKSSTEKWVESSMAFVQDLSPLKLTEDDPNVEEVTSL